MRVVERVARLGYKQVVRIVADACHVAELIDGTLRQEEVSAREGDVGRIGICRIEDMPRSDPQRAVAIEVTVSTLVA